MRHLAVIAFVMALSSPAYAQFSGPTSSTPQGGYTGPVTTVAGTPIKARDVQNARDDQPVVLTGYIIERLKAHDDDYVFKDETGTLVVEIDDGLIMGRQFGPETQVMIEGHVDTHRHKPHSVDATKLVINPVPASMTTPTAK